MFPAPMTIGEVAARVGLRTSALRYYESVGILPAPMRVGGQRRYDAGVLRRVEIIQAAQKLGFSIKEIKSLLSAGETELPYSDRLKKLAREKLTEADNAIAQAQQQKAVLEAGLICRCGCLEDCYLFVSSNV